tara:strand:+ start:3601 stop:4215 length:615 start_codon:yes stop_codon:yes gene_type:complete
MSWLKSLDHKRFLKLFRRDASLSELRSERRFSFLFRWNQSTKVVTGLLASVFSMMSLISFFGSLEEQAAVESGASLAPELGASDELSLEFGLNASLPVREPGSELTADPLESKAVIRTVSVQQAVGTAQNDSGVYHAVGQEFGQQKNGGHVEQIAGERPYYVSRDRQPNRQIRSTQSGAAWLTGEIEAADERPANGSARRFRNQ